MSLYSAAASAMAVAARQKMITARSMASSSSVEQHIIILGGGIAGLSTARYLLGYTHRHRNVKITLIDRNAAEIKNKLPSPTYEEQHAEYPHFSTPSRRNGNVLCPSLNIPWTSKSLLKETIMPAVKSVFATNDSPSAPLAITFDWKSLISDRSMYSFATHYLLQKLVYKPPRHHQCNKSILEYNMKCLDDPSDSLVQSINYGRFAQGTRLVDGTVVEGDSSGDVGLFCRGLLSRLQTEYGDKFIVRSEENIDSLVLAGCHDSTNNEQQHQDSATISAAVTVDQSGIKSTIHADQFVIAMGNNSRPLCDSIHVPCPIYPVKGHLVTISSSDDLKYNITLPNGIGYAAPMDHKVNGRRLYRLSGFVDFTSTKEPDEHRIEALVDAAKLHLNDVSVIDESACHRPFSADDRPIIGPAAAFGNLYLCTGFGSRGWSIGLGSGSLLASLILGLPCNIDPEPYLPRRFGTRYF
eukprot:CAMPEP_0201698506 /NCGR_PEP_ID=MMETSP0578-20130828/19583_1 /ASSEMBLY_ACC=CAM_ASM_000663 /TAXON_ID=267565 /ORGANISM="Skeletonema grethea, Strain CCMP 1804" /LENGTH=467 /DNA_ID=CAMNT_0048185067 /DNA_START=61 /DNA_END=1464 /DNA_ORIENTATION=-